MILYDPEIALESPIDIKVSMLDHSLSLKGAAARELKPKLKEKQRIEVCPPRP
jgi:hypothetical protein